MFDKVKAIAVPAGIVCLAVIVATQLLKPLYDFIYGPTGWVQTTRNKTAA